MNKQIERAKEYINYISKKVNVERGNPTFFKEMGIAMTVTSLTFGAGNYVQIRRNLNKKKKK